MFIDGDDMVHVAEGTPDGGVCLMTLDGEIVGRWGDLGGHGLWIDSTGDVYFCRRMAFEFSKEFLFELVLSAFASWTP